RFCPPTTVADEAPNLPICLSSSDKVPIGSQPEKRQDTPIGFASNNAGPRQRSDRMSGDFRVCEGFRMPARPAMTAPRTLGPAYENHQRRKPRERGSRSCGKITVGDV